MIIFLSLKKGNKFNKINNRNLIGTFKQQPFLIKSFQINKRLECISYCSTITECSITIADQSNCEIFNNETKINDANTVYSPTATIFVKNQIMVNYLINFYHL